MQLDNQSINFTKFITVDEKRKKKKLVVLFPPALRIHVSQPTINILQRTNCKFEYEIRGETYLKVKRFTVKLINQLCVCTATH